MGKCIVDCCTSRTDHHSGGDISFFRFPKQVDMKIAWVKVIKKKDWVPSKCSQICSLHFEQKCMIFNKNGVRNVTKNAVPTLNLPKAFTSNKGTQIPEEPNPNDSNSDTDEVNIVTSPCLLSFYSDVSSTPSTSTSKLNLPDSESLMVISDDDSPLTKRLKQEVRRLFTISETRRKTIKILQQSKRRSKKKVETLTNSLNKLNEEKLINKCCRCINVLQENEKKI